MTRTGLVASCWLVACAAAPDRAASDEPMNELDLRAAVSGGTSSGDEEALRVLVTGFNDWKGLGEPPNVWRCRDNPSCRLLVGDETPDKPSAHQGPLARRLLAHRREDGRSIAWSFATMPVTWGVADSLEDYTDYDIVVHLGLGVYDTFDELMLEDGAYNLRKGEDAAGRDSHQTIGGDAGSRVLDATEESGIAGRVRGLNEQHFGDYTLVVARAREDNAYLCNETHYRALERVNASVRDRARLQSAYFLHIPYAKDDDYERLADGVAAVVFALVK